MTEIHLSPREQQVLQGVADGWTTEYIAFQLGISPRTVVRYLEMLRSKFKSCSSVEMMAKAVTLGCVEVKPFLVFEVILDKSTMS